MFSAVAGAIKFVESLLSLALKTASLIAEKTDKASINGGSPTAFDLFTTFSIL